MTAVSTIDFVHFSVWKHLWLFGWGGGEHKKCRILRYFLCAELFAVLSFGRRKTKIHTVGRVWRTLPSQNPRRLPFRIPLFLRVQILTFGGSFEPPAAFFGRPLRTLVTGVVGVSLALPLGFDNLQVVPQRQISFCLLIWIF